ncbi:MAG: hypothetical protein ACUVYA_16320 [Planctomycetota bacterium]
MSRPYDEQRRSSRGPEYSRLPGRGRGSRFFPEPFRTTRLWLGKDHLLLVETTGYSERYKRFYYRDIRAINVARTNRGERWTAVYAFLFIGFLVLALAATNATARRGRREPEHVFAAIAFAIPSALFLAGAVANLILGPTAVCRLRTAVQTAELGPLNRVRRADKALRRIRPLIAAAQGELSPDEVQALASAAPASPQAQERSAASSIGPPQPPPIPRALEKVKTRGDAAAAVLSLSLLSASAVIFLGLAARTTWHCLAALAFHLAAAVSAARGFFGSRVGEFRAGRRFVAWSAIAQTLGFYFFGVLYGAYSLPRESRLGAMPLPNFAFALPDVGAAFFAVLSLTLGLAAGALVLSALKRGSRPEP